MHPSHSCLLHGPGSLVASLGRCALSLAGGGDSRAHAGADRRVVAEVLSGGDAGRLPQGRRREPLDRQPRPARARARPPSWSTKPRRRSSGRSSAAPTDRCSSAPATKARCSASTRRAKARCSSTAPSSRCTRSRRRPTAGSTSATSPDGKIYKVDRDGTATDILRPRRQIHLGARRRREGQRLRRHRRQGRHLQDHARRQRRAVLQDEGDARDRARLRQGRQLCSSAPASPGKVLRVDPDGKAFVLLDSPFQEIRALRFDDKGMLYVAALSGRPLGGAPPSTDRQRRRRSPAADRRAPIAVGVRRDHLDVDRRHVGRRHRERRDRRARIAARRKGAVYRIAPDGLWDQLWESRDDSPYDLTFDAAARSDHRHRQQGQDLSARRRSAAADAARARQRAAGHRLLQGRARPAVLRDRQPGQAVPALVRARARAAPTNRNRATRRWSRPGAR